MEEQPRRTAGQGSTLAIDGNFAALKSRAEKSMANFDRLHPMPQKLVHEYGQTGVQACIQLGVKKPRQIEHLITSIRFGVGVTPVCNEAAEIENQKYYPKDTLKNDSPLHSIAKI